MGSLTSSATNDVNVIFPDRARVDMSELEAIVGYNKFGWEEFDSSAQQAVIMMILGTAAEEQKRQTSHIHIPPATSTDHQPHPQPTATPADDKPLPRHMQQASDIYPWMKQLE